MIYYVNAAAPRDGNGSKQMPFKHINTAAKIARPGDVVSVAPGVYREYVNPVHAGREDARIEYRSEKPLGARITGAELLTGWVPYQGTTWMAKVDNGIFGTFNPFKEPVIGDWYFYPKDPATGKILDMHRGAVYMNDQMFYETFTLEECVRGEVFQRSWQPELSVYKWFAEVGEKQTTIYANFQGKNPNEECVEINVRNNCFMPDKKGVSYITLSGFVVDKAATNWAPPAAFQDGMIGAHWSKGWIIEDCDISNSRCCGISIGNYHQTEKGNDNYFTNKHVKSPTQMERDAVCIAQYDGWTKETVGSHIVRRCHIHDCGQAGIVGRMGCVFSIIEDNHIHNINNSQQLTGAEMGGIKFHAAIDVTFRRNHIHHCTMGIWCDWQAQGTRITQNLLHDNHPPKGVDAGMMKMSQDIFVEVGHGPTLIDNNVLLSEASVRWATQGVAVVHNLIAGAFTCVGAGTDMVTSKGASQRRYTPYHIPHRTEVAGFMTILHGDNRVYNNIFVQKYPYEENKKASESMGFNAVENDRAGNAVWDEYPTYEEWIAKFKLGERADMTTMMELMDYHFEHLPVWVDGNAYFCGALPWNREANKLVDNTSPVKLDLVEKDGKYTLDTNVYDFLQDFRCGMIHSDILGQAFEPEERFENTDGTAIMFNEDFLGDHRGTATIPGPFASGQTAQCVLAEHA